MDVGDARLFEMHCKEMNDHIDDYLSGIESPEDDEIMVDIIDQALWYLDKHCDFVSQPVTVRDMRIWLREKFPSRYVSENLD